MTQTSEFQNAYNYLYECMRKYIWDYDVIEALADVEVKSYQRFPNTRELSESVARLKYLVSYYDIEDKELMDAISAFDELDSEQEELYSKIDSFQEVLQVEDH